MGHARKRTGADGRPRYTAYYDDHRGIRRSAGTFATRREADRAWRRAEEDLARGRLGDPRRGRQRFREYVEETWLPNHPMEPSTRQGYTYSIAKHILPEFGDMRMVEILPEHVRAWVTKLQHRGVSAANIRYLKNSVLSAIFTTAFEDQVTFLHPCRGVKTPTVPKKPRTIVTPEQFDVVFEAVPEGVLQLLVETEIETGLRWGELTELRPRDLDMRTRILTVSRAVVEIEPKFHPEGKRFLVKEYPKDKEYRRLKLTQQIVRKLAALVEADGLGPEDLLFSYRPEDRPARLRVVPDPEQLGFTEPNAAGRRYRHGSLSGYSAGRCRCRPCRDSYAIYRANRRAAGRDAPRHQRRRDTDGHIPRGWFRNQIWLPALKKAKLGFHVRPHDLRHAHASWLLAGGADLQIVKERLGHASIATTERYLHTLPDADETALEAFSITRNRAHRSP